MGDATSAVFDVLQEKIKEKNYQIIFIGPKDRGDFNSLELFQLFNIWLVLHGKRSYIWEELKVRVRPFSILYKIERKAA